MNRMDRGTIRTAPRNAHKFNDKYPPTLIPQGSESPRKSKNSLMSYPAKSTWGEVFQPKLKREQAKMAEVADTLISEIVDISLENDNRRDKQRKTEFLHQHAGSLEGKNARKIARKENKTMKLIMKEIDCEISNEPTQWVALWGPSLSLGTPKSVIRSLFDPEPMEIRLYYNKMFCAMRFSSAGDAEKAKKDRNGTNFMEGQPMYVVYLKNEPPKESGDFLAPFTRSVPEGLSIINNFISKEEEEEIMKLVPSNLSELGQALKRRWVRHFGYDFDYATNNVDPDKPSDFSEFPPSVIPVLDRLVESKIVPRRPEQITLNHYLPGQGIPPHVDTHSPFEEQILSLSLGSPVVMDFRDGDKHFSVILPQRSLLVMTGEARYQWTHGIANRTYDVVPAKESGIDSLPRQIRMSLTFRLLRKSRICPCKYPYMCDSQKGKITAENAANLENSLVHKVYDDIASHFSSTRHTPWPRIKDFVCKLAPWESLLDVGCGNGKYLGLRDSYAEVGTDMSSGLLKIAKNDRKAEAVRCNCLTLPFKDCTFDAVICIAVLHHLSTKERRLQALREILRVLRASGKALIYVWAKHQKVEDKKSVYAEKTEKRAGIQPGAANTASATATNYSFLPIHDYGAQFSHNDTLVPWISGPSATEVHHRYYHVFDDNELVTLVKELEDESCTILDSYYDQGNWCVQLQKTV